MTEPRIPHLDLIARAVNELGKGRLPSPVELPPDCADEQLTALAASVNAFLEQYKIAAGVAQALSRGDLEFAAPRCRLHICDSLKHLQSNLRHLTWKTQQVAREDYSQRVDFMGEFSASFNAMVDTLAARRDQLLRHNQELQEASRTDALTALLNRRGMWDAINRESGRTTRNGKCFGLVMADIDHFKRANDVYGHDAGDRILKDVASVIRGHVRSVDYCARWGGEEFLVLLAGTDLHGAMISAERLRSTIEALEIEYEGRTLRVTLSMGVGVYDGKNEIETCLRNVDLSLYAAKDAGRNRVCSLAFATAAKARPASQQSQGSAAE
jgi:diguanylate cyclase (GGDEF)-like protein